MTTDCGKLIIMRLPLIVPLTLLAGALAWVAIAQDQPAAHTPPARCLPPAAWHALTTDKPAAVTAEALLRDMAKRQVVLLGEIHDSAEHHAWQLQTLAALHVLRPQMVIGFEAFPRRVQPVLDRWVAGELTQREFLQQVEWEKVWNFPPALYLPLFEFARINRIPMIALNVDRALTAAVSRQGWENTPDAVKEGVSRPARPPEAYEKILREVYLAHVKDNAARQSAQHDDAFRYFVESQTTWDRAMAEALASRVKPGSGAPLLVGIMGSGHVRHGHGVAHQLRDLGVKNVGLLLPVSGTDDCGEIRTGLADAVFTVETARREPAPPPRLGVQLGTAENAVLITSVTAGSLAERTGLKAGDRVISVGGTTVTSMSRVIAAIREQPAGTWLPLQVKRGDEMLDLVVRFPPQP